MTKPGIAPPDLPPMLLPLAPIALLVLLLSASVALFGSDASYGPNQVALIIASAATMLVGWRRGAGWQAIQTAWLGRLPSRSCR